MSVLKWRPVAKMSLSTSVPGKAQINLHINSPVATVSPLKSPPLQQKSQF